MNEFDMNIYSKQHQNQLLQNSEKHALIRIARAEAKPPFIAQNRPDNVPVLVRLGVILVEMGEHLKARYGDALDTMTVPVVEPQAKPSGGLHKSS